VRNAASGPDATADSLPASITLALPLTGQQTKLAPRSPSRLRSAADSATAMVEQSTKIGGTVLAVPTPWAPK
jgi:hypothetical protein